MARPSGMTEMTLPPGVRAERIEPLWERVDGNRIRFVAFTVLFITIISVLASLVVAFTAAGGSLCVVMESRGAIIVAIPAIAVCAFVLTLVVTTVWSVYRLSRSEPWLLRRLGARITAKGELAEVKSVYKDITIAAGFKHSPPLYIIETDRVNAFALGRTYSRSAVGITSGFVNRLTPDQQRAVFANLVARIITADTLWATAVSALMGPIWALRDWDLSHDDTKLTVEPDSVRSAMSPMQNGASSGGVVVAGFMFYGIAVVITELLSWWHQKGAWMAAEKADAEGMLLLKDPRSMLSALECVLDRNNHVPTAGDAYSQLFYCWAGFGFAPEDDPEFQRVARLREVLGAEGLAYHPRPNVPDWSTPPPPPRVDERRVGA